MQPPNSRRPFGVPPLRASDIQRDVDAELEFHLGSRIDALVRGGMTHAAAREAAEREFGDMAATRAYCATQDRAAERSRRATQWLADFREDVRIALRTFKHRPMFAAISSLTLALGLAAAFAMSEVFHRLVWSPFPFPGGDRIVWVWMHPAEQPDVALVPWSDVVDAWRTNAHSFEAIEAVQPGGRAVLSDRGELFPVNTAACDEGLLGFLSQRPVLGRGFFAEDRAPDAPPVILLSNQIWRDRFGGSREVIGRTVTVGATPYQVVGVLGPEMRGVPGLTGARVDVWTASPRVASQPAPRLVVARLRPRIAPAAASREVAAIVQELGKTTPRVRTNSASVMTARDVFGESRVRAVTILWAASGLLLLVAAVNYTHLLLARATERRREFAVRAALGASRYRVLRQNVAEAIVLAGWALVLQVPLSALVLRVVKVVRPDQLESLDHVRFEPGVFAIAALGAIAITVACAFVATWSGLPREPNALHGGTASASAATQRLRRILIEAEVGLAFTLVVSAALLGRSFVSLLHRPLGFQADGAMTLHLIASDRAATDSDRVARQALWEALRSALESTPGVTGVSRGLSMPPGSGFEFGRLEIEGNANPDRATPLMASSYVERGFFHVAGIRLIEGTDFPVTEAPDRPMVISASMARALWPNGGAVGARIRTQGKEWYRVTGVVNDVVSQGLHTDASVWHLYHSRTELAGTPEFFLRVTTPYASAARDIRATVHRAAPNIAIEDISSTSSVLQDTVRGDRFYAIVLGIIATFGALLAAVGVFGVVASITAQRTREIALRLALGSGERRVYGMVIRDGLRPVAAGILLGIGGSFIVGKALKVLLFGVGTADPVAYIGAALLILTAGFASVMIPARRAASLEPASVLRSE